MFPCTLCTSEFTTPRNMLKHVRKYHGDAAAEALKSSRKRSREATKEIKQQVKKRRKEENDNSGHLSFNFKRDVARGASFCKVCDRMFNDAEECHRHEASHENNGEGLQCSTCRKSFKKTVNLHHHERRCKKLSTRRRRRR